MFGSQRLEDLAESHEEYGELVTNYYIAFLIITLALMVYRKYQQSSKNIKIIAAVEDT